MNRFLNKIILIIFVLATGISNTYIKADTLPSLPEDSIDLSVSPELKPLVDYKFKPTRFILPTVLIAGGIVGIAVDGMKDFHLFTREESTSFNDIDDYLEWGMLGWVFVCDLMGKEKHSFVDQLFILGIAEGLNGGLVQGIKRTFDFTRPDGNHFSFPSGHTSNAFLGAHIAFKEFKDSSPILAYTGYAAALYVAGSRVYKNRHWVADVVAGAGIGILSVELSYLIYFPIRNAIVRNRNAKLSRNLVIAPSFLEKGGGIYLSWRF